jgi:hypothetical protein
MSIRNFALGHLAKSRLGAKGKVNLAAGNTMEFYS